MDIQSVGNIYQKLSKANLHLLEGVYHRDVVFEDAAHRLEGYLHFPITFSPYTPMSFAVTSLSMTINKSEKLGFSLGRWIYNILSFKRVRRYL